MCGLTVVTWVTAGDAEMMNNLDGGATRWLFATARQNVALGTERRPQFAE